MSGKCVIPVLRALLPWAVLWALAAAPGRGDTYPAAGGSEALKPVLRQMAVLLFSDAEVSLGRIPAAERASPLGWTVEAMTLLQSQPRTEGKIDEAARLLERAWEEGGPAVAPVAGYFRARVPQAHAAVADAALAMRYFEELAERYPEHPLAEMGRVRHAALHLSLAESRADVAARIEHLERESAPFLDAAARRDFHSLLGHALLLHELDAAGALRHLLAAIDAGVPESSVRYRGYVIRIAELARVTGEAETAREYYNRFLEEFPRDDRRHMIEQRLRDLP